MTSKRTAAVKIVTGTCTLVLGVLLSAGTASAQAEAEVVRSRVKEGQKVWITDDQGREFKGKISTLTGESLGVLQGEKRADIPYASIVKIDRPHDGLANGALIGLAIGAGLGLAAVMDTESCVGEFYCSEPEAGSYAGAALIAGGLGAAIGVGIDALIRRNPAIYRRGAGPRITFSPAVARGARGAVLAISW